MYDHKDGIRLRKMHRGDLEALLELKQESWWGTHGTLISNVEDQLRWYEGLSNRELFMIAEKEFKPVGVAVYTNIDWVSRTLDISGSIYQYSRKPDIVKPAFAAGLDFAFEVLNMHRLSAEVLETNTAAQWLEINFLDFKVEGRKRQAVYKAGRYYDSLVLGLLREDWSQQERVLSYGGSCCKNFNHETASRSIGRLNRNLPD